MSAGQRPETGPHRRAGSKYPAQIRDTTSPARAVPGQTADYARRVLAAEAQSLRDVAAWNEVAGEPALDPKTLRHLARQLEDLAARPHPLRVLAAEQAARTSERRRWRARLRESEGIA